MRKRRSWFATCAAVACLTGLACGSDGQADVVCKSKNGLFWGTPGDFL